MNSLPEITASSSTSLQEFIFTSKYARYSRFLGRREVWPETVARVRAMHGTRFGHAGKRVAGLIEEAFAGVERKQILPSMRSMQFAGRAIEAHEARMFNCAAMHISRMGAFRDMFYVLLCGCGVGFSVQREHISRLPQVATRGAVAVFHRVEDSIEGWAEALGVLVKSAYEGCTAVFDFDGIRPAGTPLNTSGGKAPGPKPLMEAFERVEALFLQAQGRQLRPIEAYDVAMFLASAVVSGGVRRSATICLFSPEDEEMITAKTGDWFTHNPQRALSNNSAVLIRESATREQFDRIFRAQKEFGEPGFFFADNVDCACNPCCEIGLFPVFIPTNSYDLALAAEYGITEDDDGQPLRIGSRCSGIQFCNLTSINGGQVESPEDFFSACRLASILGTLQADFTNMPFLSNVTRLLNDREALLGVSICGIMDNPKVMLDPSTLRQGAEIVKQTNAEVAEMIGIRPAARLTCVKPEGTASLLLKTGSGIHPHHARRYFRRVQMNKLDPVLRHFKKYNPHMVEPSVYGQRDEVVTFPITTSEGALTRADLGALDFLKAVLLVQENWVVPGTRHQKYARGLHNVSNTVSVKDEEWDSLSDLLWDSRNRITGVSMLSDTGDKVYAQAPREEVVTAEDEARFAALSPKEVNWAEFCENDDNTAHRAVAACAGGACELHV